jgi:hypothetical protein
MSYEAVDRWQWVNALSAVFLIAEYKIFPHSHA